MVLEVSVHFCCFELVGRQLVVLGAHDRGNWSLSGGLRAEGAWRGGSQDLLQGRDSRDCFSDPPSSRLSSYHLVNGEEVLLG